MPFGGLLTVGLIGAGGSLFGGLLGKSAANTAASQQAKSAQDALDFQKQVFATQQANQQPYQQAGAQSIGTLMDAIKNGQFGFGSNPSAPQFTAPTLEQARQDPGYQFTREQGTKGVLQGSSAAGGAISGGTLRALDTFGSGLADTTYGGIFNRSLQSYGANLQSYQTNLAKQAQEYQQMFAPAQLGENAVASINNTGTAAANNIGSLMTQQGNALASGTVGGANALASGISGAGNSILQSVLLGNVLNPGKSNPVASNPNYGVDLTPKPYIPG